MSALVAGVVAPCTLTLAQPQPSAPTMPAHVVETGEVDPQVANASVQAPAPRERESADIPKLVRRSDGHYGYSGRGFNATILGDGTVVMRDVFMRSRPVIKSRRIADNEWRVTFWETKFDFLGWLTRKFGDDPNRSERRWFLEGTRDLRERLATQSAADAMHASLSGIWSRAGVSFAERKRLTFTLWDESSDDEQGQVGRDIVETYVRERCPRESALGFSDSELRTLNAARKSRRAFAPYEAPSPARE